MNSELAARLTELRAALGDVRVLVNSPEKLLVVAMDADPEPRLIVIDLEHVGARH